MNKQEFLARLGDLLACLPADKIAESQAFYAEAIDDRMEDGMTEEEAVAALGSPGAVAEAILDELPAVPRAIAKTKRRSTVLLWTLAIVGSPVWLSLAFAFALTAVLVYACIWALAACVWILAAAFICAFPLACLIACWGLWAGNVPYALVQFGFGLLCLGLGVACLGAAWNSSRQLARLSRVWMGKVASPFVKRFRPDAADGDGKEAPGSRTEAHSAC